ncbi:MAG: hypothetical protein U1F52_14375 [Burkholderiales bacterium]
MCIKQTAVARFHQHRDAMGASDLTNAPLHRHVVARFDDEVEPTARSHERLQAVLAQALRMEPVVQVRVDLGELPGSEHGRVHAEIVKGCAQAIEVGATERVEVGLHELPTDAFHGARDCRGLTDRPADDADAQCRQPRPFAGDDLDVIATQANSREFGVQEDVNEPLRPPGSGSAPAVTGTPARHARRIPVCRRCPIRMRDAFQRPARASPISLRLSGFRCEASRRRFARWGFRP